MPTRLLIAVLSFLFALPLHAEQTGRNTHDSPATQAKDAESDEATKPGDAKPGSSDAATRPDAPAPLAAADLRPHFVAGRAARYELWRSGSLTRTVAVGARKQTTNSTFGSSGHVRWSVDKVNADGSAQCSITIEWMAVETTDQNNQTQRTDSRQASGDDEELHRVLKAVAGQAVRVDMNADGSVAREPDISRLQQPLGTGKDDPKVEHVVDYAYLAATLATVPAAPESAKPGGASWQVTHTRDHRLGQISQPTTYQLASLERIAGIGVATLESKGRMSLNLDRSKLPAEGPQLDVRMTKGEYTSQVMVDLARHEVVGRHATQAQALTITATMPGGEQAVVDMAINAVTQLLRIAEEPENR